MATAMKVPTIFTAVDRFSNVVQGMTRSTQTFSAGLNRMDRRLNNSFNKFSQFALAGGVGGLLYKAGDDIIEYEKSIASLAAVTKTKIGAMNTDIQGLARESGRSVIDITKSFENIGSKMSEYLTNPQALRNISRASILLADASRMDIEEATEGLTSLMNQFGLKHDKALYLVNKLSAGEDVGAATISQTIDMTRQFAASIRMAGGTAEEAIALVQATSKTMGNMGVGRGFRNIAIDMITGKGMDKNKQKALAMVGADIDVISAKSTHFYDRLKEIKKLLGNNQAMGMFFKKTGMEAGGTFLREFETYDKYLKSIHENNSAFEKAAKNSTTFAYTLARLKDKFTNLIVTDQDANNALGITKNIIIWMTNHMGFLINLIGSVVVAFMAWKAIVGIVTVVSGVMTAFNAIMSVHRFIALWASMTNMTYAASMWAVATAALAAYWPILLIVAAIGALVYAFWDSSRSLDQMVEDQVSSLMKGAGVTENMVSRQIASLDKGNQAMMNNTKVVQQEINKQNAIKNAAVKTAVGTQQKYAPKANTPQENMKAYMKNNLSTYASRDVGQNDDLYTPAYVLQKRKNLAGVNANTISTNKPAEVHLSLTVNDKGNVIDNIVQTNKQMQGVKVVLTPNQGQRGN